MKTNKKSFSKEYSGIMVITLSVCITLLMMSPIKANAQELIGLWHFDEASGTVTYDSFVNSYHGTLLPTGFEPIWDPFGRFDYALLYSVLNYVEVPETTSLEPETITVEAWVKRNGYPGGTKYIVSKYLSSRHGCCSSYALYTAGGGVMFYVARDDGGTWIGTPVGGAGILGIWDGEWHHVAGTFNGTKLELYIDGSSAGSTLYAAGILYSDSGANDLFFGSYTSSSWLNFPGGIDEVRIYNGVLSEEMIQNHADGYYECSIDIKPGSDLNSINLGEQGKLTVAILGSLQLDVTTIDPATIMLGGEGPVTRGKAQKLAISFENVNEDGYTDLVAHFGVQALVEAEPSSLTENTTSLTLLAELFNGLGIIGIDSVRVVPPQ